MNRLIQESSPYLLQHAHNPVDWFPWGEEALQKAQTEDKPIIVSIGYSACHWCHVMERECFESETLAQLMNEKYICIKVDREERPDVDAIYMDAIHAMGLQGGWPLNVFLTPKGKPFYGGTYFPPAQWQQVLENVALAYKNQKQDLLDSAEKFAYEINLSDVVKYGLTSRETNFTNDELEEIYRKVAKRYDKTRGGTDKSPKFPMPSIYMFLLRYVAQNHETQTGNEALRQLTLTLNKMACGGIYDQIGGGFARYSTDADWFAPHFEKMLYDNGQLLSLYSEAYTLTKNELYKEVVYDTIGWLKREMTSSEGAFYSALDADSEGIEGKFYVWTWEEWEEALSEVSFPHGIDENDFTEYFNITEDGNWEHGFNILYREESEADFCQNRSLSLPDFLQGLSNLKKILIQIRAERVRPGLDDKILCSWNGLSIKGLTDAYRAFDEPEFMEMAIRNADFILSKMQKDVQLFHSYKNGKCSIPGYLEDYAFVIEGFIALYEATFDEKWLNETKKLTDYVLENFYDLEEELFFFTDKTAEKLIARKKEVFDNVIPASNSAMAKNLYLLGIILEKEKYRQLSEKMLARLKKLIIAEPNYLTNWANLFTYLVSPTAEVAIVGKDAIALRKSLDKTYFPNKIVVGTSDVSDLILLENREAIGGKTTVYVCYNRTCRLPVFSVEAAISELKEGLV
jgi:hypothetical protein